jgi:hypothetical protein
MTLVHETPHANGSYRVDHEGRIRHAHSKGRPAALGIEHSIRPGAPCPETVVIVVMTDGSHLLVDYLQGMPAAFVTPKDAAPLRQVLGTAFGNLRVKPVDGEGSTPSAVEVQP